MTTCQNNQKIYREDEMMERSCCSPCQAGSENASARDELVSLPVYVETLRVPDDDWSREED
jgi:hypothetical protein